MVWASNSTVSGGSNNPVVVQLLNSGNLVLLNKNKMIWQSFDYPGDTFLPGMKLGKDLVTGLQRYITSWKSPDDPSLGVYSNILDINGYPQFLGWQGEVVLGRLGPWNGLVFSVSPIEKDNHIYSMEFVINEKEIYHKYAPKSSVARRLVLTWDGKTLSLHWIERIQDWIVYDNIQVDSCFRFSLCGPYGICRISQHPPCSCMQGFEPRNPEKWEASDWGSGCIRKKPLHCGNGNGNVRWFSENCRSKATRHDVHGIIEFDTDQNIYITMSASELQVAYACRKIKKRPNMKRQGKCLDWFLFDDSRSSMLNSPQRFNIIHGIAREYAVHWRFSIKSDVFSFGVLVLEIICGKKNREFSHGDHGDNLLGHLS
ncbi:hypothetical protein L1987_15756 [Smallanthus sonchifolius]|uniref:Uncharacterized protein n=1 Tax=Smallanthus sonchifolius TaxID=185202 RepID=A0ACB9J8J9_9ASTR|nr:hypothetical protein L1987_15756 [Smallanthus sonchifolius]